MQFVDVVGRPRQSLVEALYMESFPREERKPFSLMIEKCNEGKMELLSIEGENGEFFGLAFFVLGEGVALLDYFAVDPKWRDKGIGSEALWYLERRHPGKVFMVEIEDTKVPARDHGQRLKRKQFYMKGGMKEMPFRVKLFGVEMEIMTFGGSITYEKYHATLEKVFGDSVRLELREGVAVQ